MGRAKSKTKRRPKGKRGWRQIDADQFINPSEELSLEEQKARIEQLRNSQIWSEDVRPRKRKLTKAQKKAKAKKKLKKQGFEIESIKSNDKWVKKLSAHKKRKRLFSWKESQKFLEDPFYEPPKEKDTMTIKYKNGNKTTIKLNNHPHIKAAKKNIKKNTDYNKNNKYNIFKTKHGKQNTKDLEKQDLWGNDDTDDNDKENDKSSDLEDNDQEIIEDKDANLGDIKPTHIMRQQRKSYGSMTSKRAVQNDFVSSSLISLPRNGESVNPMKHDYYYLRWQALQTEIKQLFHRTYQKKSTMKWYKECVREREKGDYKLEELQIKADKMKKLYYDNLKIHKSQNKKLRELHKKSKKEGNKNNDKDNEQREISKGEKWKDIKDNRKNSRLRRNFIRKKMKLAAKTGGHIYGPKYRFKARIPGTMGQQILKNNKLRTSLHSGIDHPLGFMFNEMQKQNKIQGARRCRAFARKGRGFFGPRYKVSTRIGKIHHANIGNPLFDGIDD